MGKTKHGALRLIAVCLSGFACTTTDVGAATYYVAITGNDSNNGSQISPWRTVAYAASRVAASDVVRVQPGTYAEEVIQTTDGTEANPITYVADGNVVLTGMFNFQGADYVRLIGFTIDRNLSASGGVDAILFEKVVGCEVWHCTFREYLRAGIGFGSSGGSGGTNTYRCLMIGNTFYSSTGTPGAEGETAHIGFWGNDNLISHNTFNGANVDYITWFGQRNRVLNNYGHSPNSASDGHVDFLQTGAHELGHHNMLVEGNFYVDTETPYDHHHASNLENTGPYSKNLLFRRNIFHDCGTGVHGIYQNWVGIYFVHESYIRSTQFSEQSSNPSGIFTASSVENVRIFNSLFVETWGTAVTRPWVFSIEGDGFQHDYNLAWDLQDDSPSWSGPFASEPHRITADPLFVNYAVDDFHVRANSPAVNRAGPLTQVTSGSGSGTTFTVGDGGFFVGDNPALSQYGGNLVVGDTITVGSTQLTIASIDGNNITTTSSFSWNNGDPVALGGDNIPTIGALPYRPEGYVFAVNISSHSEGQSVFGPQTISASADPGLVRYVVFFVDGIPVEVDDQSPYTYVWNTTGLPDRSQHTIEARAYSMYGSKQPWVGDAVHLTVSTSTGPRPSPPRNLRIRP